VQRKPPFVIRKVDACSMVEQRLEDGDATQPRRNVKRGFLRKRGPFGVLPMRDLKVDVTPIGTEQRDHSIGVSVEDGPG
jgi:hypothetical protein